MSDDVPNCEHCGDRWGSRPATHRAEWRTPEDLAIEGREHVADLCDDCLASLRLLARGGGINGLDVRWEAEEAEMTKGPPPSEEDDGRGPPA